MPSSPPLCTALGWPVPAPPRGDSGWRFCAGTAATAALAYDHVIAEEAQAEALDLRPSSLPAPALAIFPAAEGGWHFVSPSPNADGRVRAVRLRVPPSAFAPGAALPRRLAQLLQRLAWGRRPPDVVRLLDPARWRAEVVADLLAAHPQTSAAPLPAEGAAAWLASAIRTTFGIEAADVLAEVPVHLREDTPECAEMAVTPHLLEAIYEAVAWPVERPRGRQEQGSFHTPVRLVYHMARECLAARLVAAGATDAQAAWMVGLAPPPLRRPDAALVDVLRGLRIVDPSVGPGSFLVGVAGVLLEALRRLDARGPHVGHVLSHCLYGVDTSALAVATCRARLRLLAAAHGDPAWERHTHLVVGNALVDDASFAWRTAFSDVLQGGGFDLAIGNPPYLRDSRKKDMPDDLASRYRAATSHYDLYALFMERSLEMLRDGGRTCLLTSNRYLAQKYGRGIRELLLEHQLENVIELAFRAFDAGVTTCITTARKAPPPPAHRVLLARVAAGEALPRWGSGAAPGSVTQESLSCLPGSPFRIGMAADGAALAQRLQEGALRFADLGFVTLGMVFHDPRAAGRRKADYLSTERREPYVVPLVDGEHVARWRYNGNLWLHYCPAEHREPRFPELFAATKLVCKRIIGRHRIQACADEASYYFSDNTVGFVPYHALQDCTARAVTLQRTPERVAASRACDVYFLAALLNSRLLSWYYRTLLGFGVHFYPAHLKSLPVRCAAPAEQAELAGLAHEAAELMRDRGGAPDRATLARLGRLDAAIDERVERLYGLDKRESARVAEDT